MIIGNIRHKFRRLALITVLLSFICLAPVTSALADTTFPEEFRGDVTVNGVPAPVGAKIIAKIDGVECGSFTITEAGKYGGTGTFEERLVVSGNEADIGLTITFWINDTQASQTPVYEPAESKELDLSITQTYTYPLSADNAWITCALNYLRDAQETDGSIGGLGTSAWAVMAIAAAGEDPNNWKVGTDSIVDYLRGNTGSLGDIATDWARSILAITATEENPWNFGGVDYVTKLKTYYNNNQIGSTTLINDDFWGVLALISASESQSSDIITDSVAFIKNNQNDADHGWSYVVGGVSDADNTAAAVMALMAAGEDADSTVIVNALAYLKIQQRSDGGITSEGATNSAVDSWVINAIKAAGQSPTSSDWTENGNNPVGHLLSLQIDDGSFNWQASLNSNPEWRTADAIPALLGKPYPVAVVAPSDNGGDDSDSSSSSSGSSRRSSVSELPPGTTDVSDIVSSTGVFTEGTTALSEDGNCEFTIDEDTIGLTKYGEPLDEIAIIEMEDPPSPPQDSNVIGLTYDLGPDEATFDPPITLTFTYDPDDIPEGVNQEDLVIAMWDEDTDEWVELDCTVDTGSNTITASVSHFTPFTILAYTCPAAFAFSNLSITPAEVNTGESVAIGVLITNTGDLSGSHTVTIKVNNVVVETEEITVAGGDSEPVSFNITKDVAGTYTVEVDGLSGSFTVREATSAPAAPPPPASPPSPPAPPPPKSTNWPVISGVIVGVIVIGLLIFLVARRMSY